MSSVYTYRGSQSKNAGTSIEGFPPQFTMEALKDDPRFILKKFNAPRCFKGFRSHRNDISERERIIIDLTNEPDDVFDSYDAQNPISLDNGSEHNEGIPRECTPQMFLKGNATLAKKLQLHGEPLQYPKMFLRRSIGKRDFPICMKRDDYSSATKDNVSGDEVSYSNGGGTSTEYSPLRVLKVDCVSIENSNVCNKTKYGYIRGKGHQQLCDKDIRHRVKETLELFRQALRKLQEENNKKPRIGRGCDYYSIASNALKMNRKWLNTNKCLGSVPGVEIGDEFQSKMELRIVGLHHLRFCGIDYLVQNGVTLATSVVATKRYANKIEGSSTLVYIGEGGNPQVQSKRPLKDQKLERGNLALKNNIEHKALVRVIRQKKSRLQNGAKLVYVYEGLHSVETYRQRRGKFGKLVFEFLLRKISENTFNENEAVLSIKRNLEQGIEKSPYLSTQSTTNSGCNCGDECFECSNCLCMIKNDGKIPYDCDGCLIKKIPFIYECGPSCKCSLSCMNRVSQRGTQAKLELFKNKFTRCGVRSKSYISKGSFICKYVPREEFLSKEIPKEINDVTMDVSEYADVGRFIGNSSSPNLYGQEVIIGHGYKSHMMLFSMRNILPWEELTIGYNNQILNT